MTGTPWHQYGLIVRIAKSLEHTQLGKTKLQKLVFLMQELKGVPTDYRFHFYTYGPYSSSLTGDASYLDAIGGLGIRQHLGFGAYEILPGKDADSFLTKSESFLDEHKDKIDAIIEQFGRGSAQDLELIATLVYIAHYEPSFEPGNDQFLIDRARELKPKFGENEIRSSLGKLKDLGYLNAA
jgi:uncharacterized protein YwgA